MTLDDAAKIILQMLETRSVTSVVEELRVTWDGTILMYAIVDAVREQRGWPLHEDPLVSLAVRVLVGRDPQASRLLFAAAMIAVRCDTLPAPVVSIRQSNGKARPPAKADSPSSPPSKPCAQSTLD